MLGLYLLVGIVKKGEIVIRLLTREDIVSVFTMDDAISAVEQAFVLYSSGKTIVPQRIALEGDKGTFLIMPAYASSLSGASLKIASVLSNNPQIGLPSLPAQVMYIDGNTGIVEAILDGSTVTQYRTGAATGLAFSHLAVKNTKIGGLIGAGSQAETHIDAMLAVRPVEEIRVYDLNAALVAQLIARVQKKLGDRCPRLIAAKTADQAIIDADLVITVTTAPTPVFDATLLKKGATVSCVGAYKPQKQEMNPRLLTLSSRVYCDSKEAVLEESGDILKPIAQGLVTEDILYAELGQLLMGQAVGRENDQEILVFETVGIGVQDLVTAKCIYEKAQDNDVGTIWN